MRKQGLRSYLAGRNGSAASNNKVVEEGDFKARKGSSELSG